MPSIISHRTTRLLATVIRYKPTIRHLKGSFISYFDINTLALVFYSNFCHRPRRYSSKQAIALIQSNHLLLSNYVIYNCHPQLPRPTSALGTHRQPKTNTSILSALVVFLSTLFTLPDTVKISAKISPISIKYFKAFPSSNPYSSLLPLVFFIEAPYTSECM